MSVGSYLRLVRPITLMLKKDLHFKWTQEAKEVIEKMKEAISSTLVLVNPILSKDFLMYVYASDFSIVEVLT